MTPRVGDLWTADVTGRVPWRHKHAAPGARMVTRVRLRWVSRDGLVVEGRAQHPTKPARPTLRVTLPLCLLLERVEAA